MSFEQGTAGSRPVGDLKTDFTLLKPSACHRPLPSLFFLGSYIMQHTNYTLIGSVIGASLRMPTPPPGLNDQREQCSAQDSDSAILLLGL